MSDAKDLTNIREAFFRWNLLGKGSETGSAGKCSYHGSVLYHTAVPSQRLVKSTTGRHVLVARYLHPSIPEWARTQTDFVVVPDIGVFSRFPGDWLEEPSEIHGRVKYILLLEAEDHIRQTSSINGKLLLQGNGYRGTSKSERISKMSRVYDQWLRYDTAFKLGWGPMPSFYMTKLRDLIDGKVQKYTDPEAILRRERTAARKQAKQALGVA